MEDLEYPCWRMSARTLAICCSVLPSVVFAQPVMTTSHLQVSFETPAGGRPLESTAVAVGDGSLLVAVVAAGANSQGPKLKLGGQLVKAKVVANDPVSRLQFFRVDSSVVIKPVEWLPQMGDASGAHLVAATASGPAACKTAGWVKQVGGKILPLALLRVVFNQPVPPPGTPLSDPSGKVAAIVFQDAGSGNAGYAIPAEAVRRVERDLRDGGRFVRGWLGLSLRAESSAPEIVRVLPNSPAAAAGVQPGDVITQIGSRAISDYADAVNAFFYLIPGEPVVVRLTRGGNPLEISLTPTTAPSK